MRLSKATSLWAVLPLGMLALSILFGCGSVIDSSSATSTTPLRGAVRSGLKPVIASSIQLYAVGTSGNGSAATPLLSQKVQTDSAGEFDLTGLYACPSSDSILYVVARGGNPGLADGTSNPSLGLLAVLGSCNSLNASSAILVDEVSTVASVWPLAAYAESSARIGFNDAADYQSAASTISSLTSVSRQATSGRVADLEDTEVAKLHSLANILNSCVNSTGGKSGDGTACGRFFSYSAGVDDEAPTDTISAAINVAKNPLRNVADLYYLSPAEPQFLPALSAVPSDWSLQVSSRLHAAVSAKSMSLLPSGITLSASQTSQFSSSVAGSANQAVNWTLNPAVGSISASGLYTAPSTIAMTQVVTVRATSLADGTKSARALITLVPPVSITVTPGSVPLVASQTRKFSASVRGSSNTAVTWSLNPAVGSISANGLYTAPAAVTAAQSVTVTATSAADASKSASAQVSLVPPVSIAMAPDTVVVTPSQMHVFSASVTGSANKAVTWTISPMFGKISASGVYTAPATITTPATVRVTATSVADISKIATATVQLSDPVSMSMTPGGVTLGPSQTSQFIASTAGSTNQAVTWSLNPVVGSISASGVYTAPSTINMTQVVTVKATSVADAAKSTRAVITLVPPVSITVTPGSVPLVASQTRQFSASVRGNTNTAVTWSVSPAVGSISATGVYTAPATVATAQTVVVTATSVADTSKAASGQVSLVPPVSISMASDTVGLTPSQTHAFSASVTGSTNKAVTWTINPIFGSISSNGVYTAPATITTPATVRVTATSVADISKIATASIQLSDPVSMSMTPGGVTLSPSQTSQFSASILGSSNQAVTWSLSPAVGTISASGLYTAPSTITMTQVITVRATSVVDATKSTRALITLITPVNISTSPAYASLSINQSRQFTSTVGGSQNKAVTWSISPAVGSISAAGVYTAPATIPSTQTVTVTATSVADPSRTASGQVTLIPPVIVSITPGSLSLTPSQMQIFSASVTGSANHSVTWSISPALGSISAVGLYTAPQTVIGTETVSIIATSRADTTKSATTIVTLTNPASGELVQGSVSVLPTVVTLLPNQSKQFSATIKGIANQSVTWTMSPAVGSLTADGLYTAPAAIATSQTIRLTAASAANPSNTQTATIQLFGGTPTLRELGAARGVLMGTAADADEFGESNPLNNPLYASTLATQYNMLEGENAMKWEVVEPSQGVYNFEPGDQLVNFAQANGMQVRGHNLCWYSQNPAWLSTLSSAQLYQELHDHIFAVMQHYKGKVFAWDVVNEAISSGASGIGTELNNSVWYNQPGIGLSGTGHIEQAFRWAHEADPSAKLFYNDNRIEVVGGKSQALLNMLKDFIARGVPIDGVGLEMHVDPGTDYSTLPAVLKSYTDLGLEVHITEMDVRLPLNAAGQASAADLQSEADIYSFVVKTCLANSRCTAIQTWGFGDKWSWIPRIFPGWGAGLPFDVNYQPKPAYNAMVQALETE